jgi:hypothetical protein
MMLTALTEGQGTWGGGSGKDKHVMSISALCSCGHREASAHCPFFWGGGYNELDEVHEIELKWKLQYHSRACFRALSSSTLRCRNSFHFDLPLLPLPNILEKLRVWQLKMA